MNSKHHEPTCPDCGMELEILQDEDGDEILACRLCRAETEHANDPDMLAAIAAERRWHEGIDDEF